jgi:hypothetical protein
MENRGSARLLFSVIYNDDEKDSKMLKNMTFLYRFYMYPSLRWYKFQVWHS